MLVSDKINTAFNEQVGHELGNSNQYLAIAAYFEAQSLLGLAKLFFKQAEEERDHAMRFVKFILEAGAQVKVPAIPAPQNEFKSAEEAVGLTLEAEIRTTSQINDLMTLAISEQNYIAQNFLQWFVNEQLEEVSSAQTWVDVVNRAGPNGLLMVEAYLAHEAK
jgi:ferritin